MFKTLIVWVLFTALSLTGLAGCATSYYGYSESEWHKLSEEEKAKTKADYERIIQDRQDQKHRDIIRQRDEQIIDRAFDRY